MKLLLGGIATHLQSCQICNVKRQRRVPSVLEASVVNDSCIPSPVMLSFQSKSTTFVLTSSSRGIIILLQPESIIAMQDCPWSSKFIYMHIKRVWDRFWSLIFPHHWCLVTESNYTGPLLAHLQAMAKCMLFYTQTWIWRNSFAFVIHDLIDGLCSCRLNAHGPICNIKRNDPWGGRLHSIDGHEITLLNNNWVRE